MKATISEANSFTDPMLIENSEFTVSISGTYVGVVTIQRVKSSGVPAANASWLDIKSYSSAANAQENGNGVGAYYYRVGIKTGNYTSGDAVCEISI